MPRVLLIQWHPNEGAERLQLLTAAGYDARRLVPRGGQDLKALREDAPDAFVIDLGRQPSQGCAVAVELRRQKATRAVPIVFAGGAPDKVGRIRQVLPDAAYVEWEEVAAAVQSALANPLASPAAPNAMQLYAGVSLPRKLGLKPGLAVALLGAPEGFESKLEPLPEEVRIRRDGRGGAGLLLLFSSSMADLRKRFPGAASRMEEGGAIWIAWPKKASGVPTDLTGSAVRSFGLAAGFVDYKICAIDQTWSGLLFARRSGAR